MDTVSYFGKQFFISDENVQQHNLMRIFKEFWADNGDYISIQYAGTESTSTNVTLNGKKGIKGGFMHMNITINRFFIGTFQDEFKQNCIDIFLCNHLKKRKN